MVAMPEMKTVFTLLLILFLAFCCYHLTFRRVRLPLPARRLYLTGTEMLFVGVLLGPAVLDILDGPTRRALSPLSTLVLGWIGMIYGCQFELARHRKYPVEHVIAALFQATVTFGAVVAVSAAVFLKMGWPPATWLPFTLLAGATAACSAQAGIALMSADGVNRNRKTVAFLRYVSSIDGLLAMAVHGGVFLLLAFPGARHDVPWAWPLGILAANGALILLFFLLIDRRRPEAELGLVVVGMILLISGMAANLGFSPLVASFLAGLIIVNFSGEKERIYRILIPAEKPAYMVLLVFLGALWQIPGPWVFAGAALYCVIRVLAKLVAVDLLTRFLPGLKGYPPRMGLGLIEQGGLPLALLLDIVFRIDGPYVSGIVGLILVAVVINELISPLFLGAILGSAS